MKLAEALVLRKHLEQKVQQLKPIHDLGEKGVFEMKVQRVRVSDEVDEAKLQIPKLTLEDITKEYDKYSKALRELDTAIQQTNWSTELEGSDNLDLSNVKV